MKKAFLLYLVAAIVMGAIVVGCDTQTKSTKKISVDLFVGDVRVSHDNGANWVIVEVGMQLSEADIIKTGNNAYCDLILPGRGVFRVSYNSIVLIKKLTAESERLSVKKGKLLANVTEKLKPGEDFRVETETAVLAVRGTVFAIEVDDEGTKAVVENGTVKVVENIEGLEDKLLNVSGLDVSDGQELVITKEHTKKLAKKLVDKKTEADIKAAVEDFRKEEELKVRKAKISSEVKAAFKDLKAQEKLQKIYDQLEKDRIKAEKKAAEERKKDEKALSNLMEGHKTGADKYVDPDKKTSVQQDQEDKIADKALEKAKEKAGISTDADKYVSEEQTTVEEDQAAGLADDALEKAKERSGMGTGGSKKKKPGSAMMDDLKGSE